MEAPTAVVRTLIVSWPQEGRVGTLAFDTGNHVTLAVEGSGAGAAELRKAWAEMSGKAKLSWVRSERKTTDDGKRVTQIRTYDYTRDQPAYFYAVLDTLSREYGFVVDIAK